MFTGDTIGDWEALKGGDNGEDPVAGLSGWSGGRLDGIDCKAGVADKVPESRILKSDASFDWDGDVNEEKSAKLSCLKKKILMRKYKWKEVHKL